MSRCLLITVPAERADDVVGVLQDELHVQNVVRNTQDGSSTIRCFTSTSNAGFIIHHLDKIGVGVAYGEVALLAVPVLLPKRRNARLRELVKQANKNMGTSHRLAVEEIYGPVASGASLNFEYIAFIICAAIIAGVGLGTNNAVMIVASMLVSPLMGPILAFTLATNLKDWRLFKQGVMVLCVGIILTFGVGYILGLLAATNNEAPLYWNWPTTEMSSRGKNANLVTGLIYAIPSGVAVALACANPNVGAVVGVAIAASLLPPITNSGLCFGYATTDRPPHHIDYVELGLKSLALFMINVACIYLAGVATFALKRVQRVARPMLSTYRTLPRIPVGAPVRTASTTSAGGGALDIESQRSNSTPAALKWQHGAALAKAASTGTPLAAGAGAGGVGDTDRDDKAAGTNTAHAVATGGDANIV